jgi:hypothetical protein
MKAFLLLRDRDFDLGQTLPWSEKTLIPDLALDTLFSAMASDDEFLLQYFGIREAGYTFILDPRDENGAKALSELNERGINLVANALAQSTDHILNFFRMLRTELVFYVGCLNLQEQLAKKGSRSAGRSPHLQANETILSADYTMSVCRCVCDRE